MQINFQLILSFVFVFFSPFNSLSNRHTFQRKPAFSTEYKLEHARDQFHSRTLSSFALLWVFLTYHLSLIILQNYVNRDSHRPSAPNFSPWKTTLEIASGIKSASGFDTSLKLAVPKGALLEPPGKTYSPWSKKSYGGATGKAGDVIGRKSEKSGSQVRSAVSQSVSTTKNYAPWSKQTGESVTKSVSASSKAVAAGSRNYSPFSRVGDIARKARGSGLEESKPVAATVTKAITSSPVTSSLPNKSYAPWAKQTKRAEATVSGNLQTKASTTLSSTAVKGNEIVSAGKTYAP